MALHVENDNEVGLEEAIAEPAKQEPQGKANFATVLRNRGFRNLWLGQVVSQVGDYFAFLAMLVIVSGFSSDNASTTAGVSGMLLSFTLPRLLFGVLAGVFVDRWDRRRTMIVSDVLRAVLVLAMIPAFLSRNLLLMYALGFVMSAAGTFFQPAKGALIPKLVSTGELMAANSLSQTSMTLANFVGPALAGATFAAVGAGNEWVAFVIDSLSFVVSGISIWMIVVPREAAGSTQHVESSEAGAFRKVWEELKVGLKALVLNRTMATLSIAMAITMLGVGAINVLWVVYLKTSFHFENAELAWRISVIDIAFFAGMVGASVLTGNFLSHLTPKWFIVWGLLGAGAFTTVLGYIPDYVLVGVVMFLVGVFVAPINTGVGTLVQLVVPNSQLGRVGGGLGTVTDVFTILSMSLAGLFGALLGIPIVFLISGLLCMAGGALAWMFIPALALKDSVEEREAAPAMPEIAA